MRRSFGFGDRLGVATPGHLAALASHPGFAPVFAQQSAGELARTDRTHADVMNAAVQAVSGVRFRQPWGADADGLKNPPDVDAAAAAGFTWFTLDPSDFVRADATQMTPDALAVIIEGMIADGEITEDWSRPYLDRTIDLPGGRVLRVELEPLQRVVVKYGRAVNHAARLSQAVARACHGRAFELEVAFDETDAPTSTLEHLFIGLELEARGVRLTGLAIRLPGDFQRGIDYRGDLLEFESRLAEHVAVAEFCGPYKLSIHGGSDKPSIYPIIGRCCGDALHVKTSGTSYLEALRVVWRTDPGLFGEIVRFCREKFAEEDLPANLATTPDEVKNLPGNAAGDEEQIFLNARVGRQLLHVTYASVLTVGRDEKGRPFREAILELLDRRADVYHELLAAHFDTHLRLLNAG